jgi:hypothetical protein
MQMPPQPRLGFVQPAGGSFPADYHVIGANDEWNSSALCQKL